MLIIELNQISDKGNNFVNKTLRKVFCAVVSIALIRAKWPKILQKSVVFYLQYLFFPLEDNSDFIEITLDQKEK
jgi:hypothetical protein